MTVTISQEDTLLFQQHGFSKEQVGATVEHYRQEGLSDDDIQLKLNNRINEWKGLNPSVPQNYSGATISAYKPPTIMDRMKNAWQWTTEVPVAAFMEQKKNNEAAELRFKGMLLRKVGKDLTTEEKNRINQLDNPYSSGRYNQANNYGIPQRTFIYESEANFLPRMADSAKKLYADVMKQTGIYYSMLKEGGIAAGIGLAGGGAIGAVGGAVATKSPQGAIAGANAGARSGATLLARTAVAKKSFELESGFMRQELEQLNQEFINSGTEPLTDKDMDNLALAVGMINATLEYVGLNAVLKVIPNNEKILGAFGKEGVKELVKDQTFRSQLAALSLNLAKSGIEEGTTEAAQEYTNFLYSNIARKMRGVAPQPLAEKIDDIMYSGLIGSVAAIGMGGIGTTAQVTAVKMKQGLDEVTARREANSMNIDERNEFLSENIDTLAEVANEDADAKLNKLQSGDTYNRIKNEMERQGADSGLADSAAQLVQQAHNVIADKFGEEGRELLERSNLQILINQNNINQLNKEARFVDEGLKTRETHTFKPSELLTDARTFQYKENSDSEGVTDRMNGVEEFDPLFAGKIIVYQTKDGKKYIVDGHQRLGLAKRTGGDNIELEGFLFKEEDGYTPEQVRVLAAQKNIAEGSGTAIDTAKIIKEIGIENLPKTIPTNSAMVKDGIALSRLGDTAFQKIINGEITPAQAARIADIIRNDEDKQIAAIDGVKIANFSNLDQVAMFAREVLAADTVRSEQINLFGTQELLETTAIEKIQIVDKAIRSLRADKKIFSGLLRNNSKIQGRGNNRLDRATNERINQQAGVAIELIERLASRSGVISDKAVQLAGMVKREEMTLDEAAKEFKAYVLSEEALNEVFGRVNREIAYNQATISRQINNEENPYTSLNEISDNEENLIKPDEFYTKGLYQSARPDDIASWRAKYPDIAEALAEQDRLKAEGKLPPTIDINTEARKKLRLDIVKELYGKGAKKQEKQAYLIIGLPASGKSSMANPLETETGSLIIDSDMAKERLPEFIESNGQRADQVHLESQIISEEVLKIAIQNGDNMILPIVGKSEKSIMSKYDRLKAAGYDVHLRLVDLPIEKTIERAVNRFRETGRLVPIDYITNEVGYRSVQNYVIMEKKGIFASYEAISTDVKYGEKPQPITTEEVIERLNDRGYGLQQEENIRGNRLEERSNRGGSDNRVVYNQSAYHGTPHSFNEFSLEHIGTGEGAQAHGWGLYFAESKEVSEGYRTRLVRSGVQYDGRLINPNDSFTSTIFTEIISKGKEKYSIELKNKLKELKNELKNFELEHSSEEIKTDDYLQLEYDNLLDNITSNQERLDVLKDIDETKIKYTKGQLFEVEIPDNNVLLDEQKNIEDQPKQVQEAINQYFLENYLANNGNIKNFNPKNVLEFLGIKTGRDFYRNVAEWELAKFNKNPDYEFQPSAIYLNDNREKFELASKKLNSLGIKGITYDGVQDGRCYVIFDDNAINILKTYYQGEANAPRGQFRIDQDGTAIIDILENGDPSTIVHELGHFYLYSLETLAKTNKRAAKELKEINNWLGKKDDLNYTEDELREFHETFARGFEAYLLEGSAPTKTLLSAFQNFKDWLKGVYNSVKDLDVDFSESARLLFERVFTTDEEYQKEVMPKYQMNYYKTLEVEAQQNHPYYKFKKGLYDLGQGLELWYNKLFIPIETRLGKISPELRDKLRNHTAQLALITGKDLKVAADFLKKTEAMKAASKEDYLCFDLALKNRDEVMVRIIADKYNFRKEFDDVRDILDDIYDSALEVGIDVGYLDNYFPRLVKRDLTEKYLEYIEALANKEQRDVVNQVIKLEDAKFSKVLRDLAEADNSQFWSTEDRAKFINNHIRGFGKNNILLSRNASLKFERNIDELDASFNQFYETFEPALVNYISNSRKTIEARKFFGSEYKDVGKLRARIKRKKKTLDEVEQRTPAQAKGKEIERIKYELSPIKIKLEQLERRGDDLPAEQVEYREALKKKAARLESQIEFVSKIKANSVKNMVKKRLREEIKAAGEEITNIIGNSENVEDSIGALVTKLAQDGDIYAKDEKLIRELLLARFNASRVCEPVKMVRDLTYAATLNDITNAVTQFGDLAFSVYKYGFEDTFKGMKKPFEISKEDLGINDMAHEFSDPSAISKWIRKQFSLIGLNAIDGLGKNTIIQSALLNAQKKAKANNSELNEKLKRIFGKDAEKVKKDLADGNITDDVIIYAYNELADIQPISEDQTAELYQTGGGFMKLFYTLKTYGIKALDVARSDITNNIQQGILNKNKGQVKKGLQNLIRLQMLLWLFGVPVDALKDLLSNRDINIFESMIDTLIPTFIVNRFLFKDVGSRGLGYTIVNFFTPSTVPVATRALSGKASAVANIPIIGKPIYNWFLKDK